MNNIKLSIIIVNYKSWHMLQQCLNSFQKFPPKLKYEIIVVDNNSRDGGFDIFAKRNPQIKLIKNSGNNGFSNGCNLGADNAHGGFLLFLNPDTVLINNTAIDDMFKFAKNNLDIGIISCRKINSTGGSEKEMTFSNPWLTINWVRTIYKLINRKKIRNKFPEDKSTWYPDWVAGSVVLIKKDLFLKAGRWNQNSFWMYYEDIDLCKRIKSLGKDIALLRHIELKHEHGGSSRINPKTTAITKTEVVTSSHVYIQLHAQGFNKILLHIVKIAGTLLSQFLKITLSFPIFWKPKFKENCLVLISTLNYYFGAFFRLNWTSKRVIK